MLIDIADINRNSPYPVCWHQKERESLIFSTDKEIEYIISFQEDTTFGVPIFHLLLNSTNRPSKGKRFGDEKIGEALFYILRDFLSRDNRVVMYVCDPADSLHQQRHRLFNSWAKRADGLFPGQFIIKPIVSPDVLGGIIFRANNPSMESYMEIFDQLCNEK